MRLQLICSVSMEREGKTWLPDGEQWVQEYLHPTSMTLKSVSSYILCKMILDNLQGPKKWHFIKDGRMYCLSYLIFLLVKCSICVRMVRINRHSYCDAVLSLCRCYWFLLILFFFCVGYPSPVINDWLTLAWGNWLNIHLLFANLRKTNLMDSRWLRQ